MGSLQNGGKDEIWAWGLPRTLTLFSLKVKVSTKNTLTLGLLSLFHLDSAGHQRSADGG